MKLDARQKLIVVLALELALERTKDDDAEETVPSRQHLERAVDELDLSDVFVIE